MDVQSYWLQPCALELPLDAVEQLGVRARVHFAPQNLLGTRDRERSNLLAQQLTRALELLPDFRLRCSFFARTFVLRRALGLVDQLCRPLFGLRQDIGCARARLLDRFFGLAGGKLKRLASLFS